MMQHALDRDCPNIATISTCINTLIKHQEVEIAILALESGADEMLASDESIRLDDLDSVVGYKTKNEFREMTNLSQTGSRGKRGIKARAHENAGQSFCFVFFIRMLQEPRT